MSEISENVLRKHNPSIKSHQQITMDYRIQQWIRRKAAAKRAALTKRRYTNTGAATTPSSRTLGRITGSYRYANPRVIQPSNNRTCSFWRSVSFSIPINQNGGFVFTAGTFNMIAFGFDLQGVRVFANTFLQANIPIANSTDFQNLFDYYKINAVKMKYFFSNTNSSVNSPATTMPLMHICNDFDDSTEILTVSTILERAGVRTMQFDSMNRLGYTHYVKPAARQVVSQINPDTGQESVSSAGIAFGSQWLDCANNNIIHSGTKVVYNNEGRTSSVDIGSMTVIFEIEYVFKGYR